MASAPGASLLPVHSPPEPHDPPLLLQPCNPVSSRPPCWKEGKAGVWGHSQGSWHWEAAAHLTLSSLLGLCQPQTPGPSPPGLLAGF